MSSIIAKSRGVYQVRIFLGKINGVSRHHTKTIKGTLKEAREYERQYRQQLAGGLNPFCKIKTFEDLLAKYKEQRFPLLAPYTKLNKEQLFKKHLIPYFGGSLQSITRERAGSYIAELMSNNYSVNTVRNIIKEAKAVFNFAFEAGIVSYNPFNRLKLPVKQNKKEVKPLTAEEISKVLNNDPDLVIRLALVSGARPSEYLGLKWEDINFQAGTIEIKRTICYTKEGAVIRNSTKTKNSRRRIAIDIKTLYLLKKLKESKNADPTDFIFTTRTGKLFRCCHINYFLKKYLIKIGIDRHFTLYWLRHSCATYLLNQGLPVKDISKRLGHASAFMTLDIYSQALEENEGKAAAAFLIEDKDKATLRAI